MLFLSSCSLPIDANPSSDTAGIYTSSNLSAIIDNTSKAFIYDEIWVADKNIPVYKDKNFNGLMNVIINEGSEYALDTKFVIEQESYIPVKFSNGGMLVENLYVKPEDIVTSIAVNKDVIDSKEFTLSLFINYSYGQDCPPNSTDNSPMSPPCSCNDGYKLDVVDNLCYRYIE